jgi:hypothetical protein
LALEVLPKHCEGRIRWMSSWSVSLFCSQALKKISMLTTSLSIVWRSMSVPKTELSAAEREIVVKVFSFIIIKLKSIKIYHQNFFWWYWGLNSGPHGC